jgi:hypothetical protein
MEGAKDVVTNGRDGHPVSRRRRRGDSRRGITRNDDRMFTIVGRDTVFTLCDGTDRAIVTVDDAVGDGSALVSDELRITCIRDGRRSSSRSATRSSTNIVRELTTRTASLSTRSSSTP